MCHPGGQSPIGSIVLSIVIPGRDCPGHVSGRESLFLCIYSGNFDKRIESADEMLLHLSEIF